jgi:hypothetical protein
VTELGIAVKYRLVPMLPLAAASAHAGAVAIVMAFGFLVGVVGHIVSSRTLIVAGILVVAVASVYVVYIPSS